MERRISYASTVGDIVVAVGEAVSQRAPLLHINAASLVEK